jgi:hypothetical protein
VINAIDGMGNLMMKDQVAGDEATSLLYTNYRLINDVSLAIQLPMTDLERLQDQNESSSEIVAVFTNKTAAVASQRTSKRALGESNTQLDKTQQLQAVEFVNKLWISSSNSTNSLKSNILLVKTLNIDTVLITINKLSDEPQDDASRMAVNFTTDCSAFEIRNYSFICPESNVELVNSCNGTAGRLVAFCPIHTIGCNLLSLAEQYVIQPNDTICETISITNRAVTCLCKIPLKDAALGTSKTSLGSASTGVSAIDQSGVLTLAVMTYFVSTEFKNTFNAAPHALSSVEATKRVLTVILMFGTLWSVGVLLILWMALLRYKTLNKSKVSDGSISSRTSFIVNKRSTMWSRMARKRIETKTTMDPTSTAIFSDEATMKLRLSEYVKSVMPSVFNTSSVLLSIQKELQRHHAYFRLLWYSPTEADRLPVLIVSQLLTNLTALMFLLALLYDLQKPVDDGSCKQFNVKDECLKRKSLLDYDQTYCQWMESDLSQSCEFNPIEINFKIQLYCVTLVSIFTSLFMNPIGFLFLILAAPVHDSSSKVTPMVDTNRSVESNTTTQKSEDIMILPNETIQAYQHARLSTLYLANAQVRHQQQGMEEAKYHDDNKLDSKRPSTDDETSFHMQQLISDLKLTRRRLLQHPENSLLLTVFDKSWGIDPLTGEFYQRITDIPIHNPKSLQIKCMEEHLLEELGSVQAMTRDLKDTFRCKSEEQAGVQLLQLFIQDLLGRDTDAAKIFRVKVKEDYATLYIVAWWQKGLAGCVLIGLNGFFLYYAILRGYRQGIEWQRNFLVACIIQMVMEIFFSETLTCLYINYLLPRLVPTRVIEKIRNVLQACIIHLCQSGHRQERMISNENHSLGSKSPQIIDAPRYLFVSTKLAMTCPTMMESMMIASYHSILPGEIGKKWQSLETSELVGGYQVQNSNRQFHVRTIITALMMLLSVSFTKFVTSAPVPLQKMTIRFFEPLIIGSIALLWSYVIKSTTSIVVFIAICLFVFCCAIYRYFLDMRNASLQVSEAFPDFDLEENVILTDEKAVIKQESTDLHSEDIDDESIWNGILINDGSSDPELSSSCDSNEIASRYCMIDDLKKPGDGKNNHETESNGYVDMNDETFLQLFEFDVHH